MGIKYHVRLADDERAMLEAMINQHEPFETAWLR